MIVPKQKVLDRIEYNFLYYFPLMVVFFNPSKYFLNFLSLPDLFIYIHSVFFLVYISIKRSFLFNINVFLIFILIVFSFLGMVINNLDNFFQVIKYQVRWVNYFFAFLIVINYINRNTINFLIKGLFLATWVVCLYGIIQTLFLDYMLSTIFWIKSFPDYIKLTFRTVSTFSNPLNLCVFLTFPLGILHIKRDKSKKEKVLLLLINITLLLTASKMAILIILITALVYFRKYLLKIIYAIIFLGSIIVIFSISDTFQEKIKSNFRLFERLNNQRLLDGSINQRKYMLESSLEMIYDNPIFGIGYENFKKVYENGYKNAKASTSISSYTSENFILDFYLDNGLIPVLIILFLVFQLIITLIKSNDPILKQLSFSIILFFFCGLILTTRAVQLLYMMFIFFACFFKIAIIKRNE